MDKLHLGEHISKQFNEELEEIRSKVLQMGGVVEEQLHIAVRALVTGNPSIAAEVVANDQHVNALEMEIDEECTRIVARRQPAASDLRLVMAVVKTVNDLERIGDEVKRVAKMVESELTGTLEEDIRQEFEHMGTLVREMLRQVLDAFARIDVDAAVSVAKADHKVDIKYESITRQAITYMAQDPKSIPDMLRVLWAARALERVGDRCENIAEYVIYMLIGKDVRHSSLEEAVIEFQKARQA
jgi:phosphate transport system protein